MSVIEVAAKVSIALELQLHKICHCLYVGGSVVGVKLEAVIFKVLNVSYEMFKELYRALVRDYSRTWRGC